MKKLHVWTTTVVSPDLDDEHWSYTTDSYDVAQSNLMEWVCTLSLDKGISYIRIKTVDGDVVKAFCSKDVLELDSDDSFKYFTDDWNEDE